MIVIHPTATHKLDRLTALQQATGLQIKRGNTYLRLEPRTGEAKLKPTSTATLSTIRAPKPKASGFFFAWGPTDDGGSAA